MVLVSIHQYDKTKDFEDIKCYGWVYIGLNGVYKLPLALMYDRLWWLKFFEVTNDNLNNWANGNYKLWNTGEINEKKGYVSDYFTYNFHLQM